MAQLIDNHLILNDFFMMIVARIEDGHAFVWATMCLCVIAQSVMYPLVGGRGAVKIVSITFDVLAVLGSLSYTLWPEVGLDPIYGFSPRVQFLSSSAAGYFAWAAVNTLLYRGSLLVFLHHVLCCAIYILSLNPFLHGFAALYLMFQASTMVLDIHSVARLCATPLPRWLDVSMHKLHFVVFLCVRVILGVPVSLHFLHSMTILMPSSHCHSFAVCAFVVVVNFFINANTFHFVYTFLYQPVRVSSIAKVPSLCTVTPEWNAIWRATISYESVHVLNENTNMSIASSRWLRVLLSSVLLRMLLCMIATLLLLALVVMMSPLPEPFPLSLFNQTLHSTANQRRTHDALQRVQHKVDSLLARRDNEPLRISGDVDVVISGGGFRGQYAGGVLAILTELEVRGLLKLKRFSGTSIGAASAASFAAGVSFEDFFQVPFAWRATWQPRRFWEGGLIISEMLRVCLHQQDVHTRLSGRVFVHFTQFTPLPVSRVVSEFSSKQQLYDAISASACIPGFSGDPAVCWYDGKLTVDGGLSNNTPIFRDEQRQQIVINLAWLQYSALYTFSPLDPHHEDLVWQGMDDAIGMLEGRVIRPLIVIDHDVPNKQPSAFQDVPVHERALHHMLLFDIISWGFYAFGHGLLFAMISLIAMVVCMRECYAVRSAVDVESLDSKREAAVLQCSRKDQ